jgi:hypothetical protein
MSKACKQTVDFFKYSVDKNHREAWRYYLQLLGPDHQPTKTGENLFYEFYELTIDGDIERPIWTKIVAKYSAKGIYPTEHTTKYIDESIPR